MHVIVLGAGLAGVSTAYYLAARGARVTVVERQEDVGLGTSFGNAAQLSYSYTDSLATPGFLRRLPRMVANLDLATRVRLDPRVIGWGLRFIKNCSNRKATNNTLALLDIALRSAELMDAIRSETDFDFSFRSAGKLVLISEPADVPKAEQLTMLKKQHGCDVDVLSPAEARAVEPAIDALAEPFAAAVYSESDEVADSYLFVKGMRDHLEKTGQVEFVFGEPVSRLASENGSISVITGNAERQADAVVVCTGAWSQELLADVGVRANVYPVRGYSVTLPLGDGAPSASITSLKHRIAISRIDSRLRLTGFADFRGFDTSRDGERIADLLSIGRRLAPQAADYDAEPNRWGGFRPMTPDGLPLVGGTRVPGLYLNTGHGMLGWTLACATGEAAASAVMGE